VGGLAFLRLVIREHFLFVIDDCFARLHALPNDLRHLDSLSCRLDAALCSGLGPGPTSRFAAGRPAGSMRQPADPPPPSLLDAPLSYGAPPSSMLRSPMELRHPRCSALLWSSAILDAPLSYGAPPSGRQIG